jgi:hypothetical protein
MAHATVENHNLDLWLHNLLFILPVPIILGALYAIALAVRHKTEELLFYLSLIAGLIAVSWVTGAHVGSAENVLIPAFALLALLFGLGMHLLTTFATRHSSDRRDLLIAGAYLVCALQLSALFYNPFSHLPAQRDYQSGAELLGFLRSAHGDVYIPSQGYLTWMSGKPALAHIVTVWDLMRAEGNLRVRAAAEALATDIRLALAEQRFSALILGEEGWFGGWFGREIEANYVFRGEIFSDPEVLRPVAGGTRPQFLYVPRE